MKTNLLTSYRLMKSLLLVCSIAISTCSLAQNKVYANGQISNNGGLLCAGCMVVNPNGAIGSNEDDYSLLKTDIGLLSGVEQVLHFPTTNKAGNMVFGLGTDDNFPMENYLAVQLLSQATVELYYEQDGFQSDKVTYNLNSSSVKINPQKPDRASFEVAVGVSGSIPIYYNRAKISIRGLVGLANKLRIYYAYYKETSKCNPPANAIHYYPFDEHTADRSESNQAFPLVTANNRNVVYKDSMICRQGLSYQLPKDSIYTLQGYGNSSLPTPQPKSPRTVSFWARVDQGGSIDLTIYGEKVKITQDSIIIRPVNENHNFNTSYFGRMSRPNPMPAAGSLNFYTLDFNNDPTPHYSNDLFQNISLFHPPYYPVDFCLSINGISSSGPFLISSTGLGGFPETTYCTHWAPYYTGKYDDTFSITLNKAQMDEFLIYDKKLTNYLLYRAFVNESTNNIPFVANKQEVSENGILTISPNPTTGSITLDGNILLLDSEISVRNLSGKEVYRTKFSTKTFELPASLSAGIYMLSVQTKDKKLYTRKVILTR